jgi:threonyl-tRNA synthetase
MIEIQFPDQSVRAFKKGVTPLEIAQSISEGLARNVLSVKVNGNILEARTPIMEDGIINLFTWNDKEGKAAFWHSSAHILAQSLISLYPQAKLTIGPAIENGFYYDVDFGEASFSEKDLPALEKQFMTFAREKFEFKMRMSNKSDALKFYKNENNPYKVELVENLEDGTISFCDHANFTDLCRGGHIPHTGFIKAVKLLSVAGAYWRGDETKPQLTRIYGISFPKQKELTEYLNLLEEAKKRDHRKLGKELELFAFSQKVGQGLPLWLPNGAALRERLENFLKTAQTKAGYEQVISPHIGNKELYMTSGHYEKYGADSFQPIQTPADEEEFFTKANELSSPL